MGDCQILHPRSPIEDPTTWRAFAETHPDVTRTPMSSELSDTLFSAGSQCREPNWWLKFFELSRQFFTSIEVA